MDHYSTKLFLSIEQSQMNSLDWCKNGVDQKKCDYNNSTAKSEIPTGP